MTIGIDARSISEKTCGVSRVVACLLKELSGKIDDNDYIVYTDKLEQLPLGPNFKIKKTGLSRMNILKDLPFCNLVNKDRIDVFFSGHSWLPLFLGRKIRKVVIVHDIFSVTDPSFFKKRGLLAFLYRLYFYSITLYTVRIADVVLTVSNYCAREIHRVYPFARDVRVMYLSPGMVKDPLKSKAPSPVEKPYLLYVGNFRSYKNIDTLIAGYARYAMAGGRFDLVLAGNDDPSKILEKCSQLMIFNRIHSFLRPDDNVLSSLYDNAEGLIQPSHYEGFGIPPLEAMSFSVPVVVSDAATLVEIASDAALIFQKNSPDDLAAKLKLLEDDDELTKNLIAKGTMNLARFTWHNAVKVLRPALVPVR